MLILEDDMNKQVTITRNGDVQIGPNQGLNINGKKYMDRSATKVHIFLCFF